MNLFCCFGKRNTPTTEALLPPSLYPTESSQNKTTAKTGSVFQHFQKADSPSSPQTAPPPTPPAPRNPFQSPLHQPVATWYTADSPSSPQTTPPPMPPAPRNPFQSPLHSPVGITQGLSQSPKRADIAIMLNQRTSAPQTPKPSSGLPTGLQFLQTIPKGTLQIDLQGMRSPAPWRDHFSLND